MARPPNPIDEHRDYVSLLYLNGVSRSQIQYKLRKHYHIAINLSTISRRIASWGLPRQQSRTIETPELIEAIHDLILRIGLSERQTLSVLQRQGWPITKRGLKHIRLHPDRRWIRRINSDEEQLALLKKTEQVIVEMTQRSNVIAGYGRRFLQPYLRQQQQLWIPRDPLFEMYKIIFPSEVEMRKRMMRRKKGQFLVPGPNYQWCINGHDKLKAYGFQIYAAIDAYLRNIIWFYVGPSASTALSVLKQYLAACDAYNFRPWYLQADRGSETPLVAAAHWNFALAAGGCDSYKAAPSTKNVRIESWWEHYFGELKNRPYVIYGQPWMNYYYPNPSKACNWGISIDCTVLGELVRPLANIDISIYLKPEIKNWYCEVLREMGYNKVILSNYQEPDKLRPFKRFYLSLRDRIIRHIKTLLAQANQAQQDELVDIKPAEQLLIELGVKDENRNDIKGISNNEGEDG
ncbi:hypothetical protein BGZ61DRAFT_468157, partial [Ilyonectria robusta]|uniref:uncharacterized protein n=1 Tax=Ilyonectria robusta TaxID=1079257 RepID=UPI001E8D81AA